MAQYNFDTTEALSDASTLANRFAFSLVPETGKEVVATSTARRGYAGQSLVTADLVSSAAGKELLSSQVYMDIFNININRESLGSLTRSVTAAGASSVAMTVAERTEMELGPERQKTKVQYFGADAAVKLVTSGALGRKYNAGLLQEINNRLETSYNNGDGSEEDATEYEISTETVQVDGVAVALQKDLSEEEISWYIERGNLIKSKGVVKDHSGLTGYTFNIPDGLRHLSYSTGSVYPDAIGKSMTIPDALIDAGAQRAYMSASAMEFILFLLGKGCKTSIDLGWSRGNNPARMSGQKGSDKTLKSGTATQKNYITDHAFGRAVDFFYIVKESEPERLLTSVSNQEYEKQLDYLLSVINTCPSHMLPDLIRVANIVDDGYLWSENTNTPGKLVQKYKNLKYVRITKDDPGIGEHRNHFHISWSPSRGGKYVGPGGRMAMKLMQVFEPVGDSGGSGEYSAMIKQAIAAKSLDVNAFRSKTFNKDESKVDPLLIVDLLHDYNFSIEIACLFTAIAYRESRYGPYAANEHGFWGLWQVGTRTIAGGLNKTTLETFGLNKTIEKNIPIWQIGYKNWKEDWVIEDKNGDKKQADDTISETQIDSFLRKSQNTPNAGKENYDHRAWYVINQVHALRAKLGRQNIKNAIDEKTIGTSFVNSIFHPWGEGFLVHGWIGGVSFKIAADLYTEVTGRSGENLADWVLKYIPKNSPTRNKDEERSTAQKTISKLESWVNLTLYTQEVMATSSKSIFPADYIRDTTGKS